MQKVITIHEAKTHLSKYIKVAQDGQPVYIGGYGKAEVMLVPAEKPTKQIKLGILSNEKPPYIDSDVMGPDLELSKDFETSINRQLP
ncbi:MAG TPA: type II toxin-antitoxin system prevent-host-death family antitoxin [Candidatus Saccharimonadales bacterium]|nr:type II toxin-antitoxin system prevent-host-death family antitoxin [Candidatus Saccharimonadales bacterium]